MQVNRRLAALRRRDEGGYVAVLVAIMLPVFIIMAAFVVDVGNWYVVSQQTQRAADAASMAGVSYMPTNLTGAKNEALAVAKDNGYVAGGDVTIDPEPVSGYPSRLQVTVSQKVHNVFGQLFGVPTENITRTAIADYQGPVPMGSPCNEFGNGPNTTSSTTADPLRSSDCSQAGQFWANVGGPESLKTYGDAFQDASSGTYCNGADSCSSAGNADYSQNGYFYQVTVKNAVNDLTFQAFDPAFVGVGDTCTDGDLTGQADPKDSNTVAVNAKNQYNYLPTPKKSPKYIEDTTLYGSGSTNPYCTGDMQYNNYGGTPPDTTFTVRAPSSTVTTWDPTSYPTASCTNAGATDPATSGASTNPLTFKGFDGNLYTALNEWTQSGGAVQYNKSNPVPAPTANASGLNGYNATVASEFRQWVSLCTIHNAPAGTYFIQVQTNDPARDNLSAEGHNRFSLRAFSGTPPTSGAHTTDDTGISVSGFNNMGIYADLPSAQTKFYMARVLPASAGQILNIRLYDIGDSEGSGTITVNPPSEYASSFSGCVGSGVTNGNLSNCSIPANGSYNGKWQQISIPIPANYTCNSSVNTGCWVTLTYDYGGGNQPSDTTSWQASIEGNPVRLVK